MKVKLLCLAGLVALSQYSHAHFGDVLKRVTCTDQAGQTDLVLDLLVRTAGPSAGAYEVANIAMKSCADILAQNTCDVQETNGLINVGCYAHANGQATATLNVTIQGAKGIAVYRRLGLEQSKDPVNFVCSYQ